MIEDSRVPEYQPLAAPWPLPHLTVTLFTNTIIDVIFFKFILDRITFKNIFSL